MNNKIILVGFAMFMFFACNNTATNIYNETGVVSSAGKFMGAEDNELTGSAYEFGTQESVDIVMEAIEAYNAKDAKKELSFYSDEMNEDGGDFTREWHEYMENLNQAPWAIIPVRLQGDDNDLVLVWSVESREWKNGSKQTLDLMEVFSVNDEGKIGGFSQWRSERRDNEFSQSTGGKFFGRGESEYAGRPLVFSNRGEVEALEKMFADYNNMDGEAVAGYFADEWTFKSATGGTSQRTSEDMKSVFDSLESVTWTPFSMTPLKIYNTNPKSGVTVYSYEKRVSKDGTVWEKELVELFYFDLDGKISGVEQFQRDVEEASAEQEVPTEETKE